MIKTNIKMRVNSKQSKQVQEICFANGIGWGSGDRSIILLNKPFLHVSTEITYGDNDRLFEVDSHEEVDASLFIKTQGTCVDETPEQELKQGN